MLQLATPVWQGLLPEEPVPVLRQEVLLEQEPELPVLLQALRQALPESLPESPEVSRQ